MLTILTYGEEAFVILVKNSEGIADLSLVPRGSENLKWKKIHFEFIIHLYNAI